MRISFRAHRCCCPQVGFDLCHQRAQPADMAPLPEQPTALAATHDPPRSSAHVSRKGLRIQPLDGDAVEQTVACQAARQRATRLEAHQQRQSALTPRAPSAVTAVVAVQSGTAAGAGCRDGNTSKASTGESTSQREMLALIERNQHTQHRLDALSVRFQRLLKALTPFAQLARAPELRLGHPDTTVLEVNRGRPDHSKLTVADFRRAEALMRELDGVGDP